MKFIPDPILDEMRQLYKKEYDIVFNSIRKLPVGSPERLAAHKEEMRLHRRTFNFLANHRFYFGQKRRFIFDSLESKGVFGKKPESDNSKETLMSSAQSQYCGIVRLKNGRLYKKGGCRIPLGAE
jgi:hypothetical protein